MTRIVLAAPVVAITGISLQGARENWPQWRGPSRTGIVPASAAPAAWPAQLSKGWTLAVGEGYSSPVSGDGRVFVHSRRDPDEVVTATAAGKHPLFLTTESELVVAQPDRAAYRELRRYSVASTPTYAHLMLLPDSVLVRDAASLTRWSVN